MGMISSQDFDQIQEVVTELVKKYPNFGGVYNWEYFLVLTLHIIKLILVYGRVLCLKSLEFKYALGLNGLVHGFHVHPYLYGKGKLGFLDFFTSMIWFRISIHNFIDMC